MKIPPNDLVIKTKRLRLRAADSSDVDFIWSATRHEGFNDGLTWNPPKYKAEIIEKSKTNREKWEKGESFMFTSELLESGERVGRTGISHSNSDWSLGFWVHPNFWGKGYAVEACLAVLEFGFVCLESTKIVTAHAIWNERSKKVIEKLGFTYTGENPSGFIKSGKPVAEHEYEINSSAL